MFSGSTELLVWSVPLALLAVSLVLAVRYGDQRDRDAQRVVYRLEFPQGVKAEQVMAFLRSLTGLRPPRGWLLGTDTAILEVLASADKGGAPATAAAGHVRSDRGTAAQRSAGRERRAGAGSGGAAGQRRSGDRRVRPHPAAAHRASRGRC